MISFTLALEWWKVMPSFKFGRHDIALWFTPFDWSRYAFYPRAGAEEGDTDWGLWLGPFTLMYSRFPDWGGGWPEGHHDEQST